MAKNEGPVIGDMPPELEYAFLTTPSLGKTTLPFAVKIILRRLLKVAKYAHGLCSKYLAVDEAWLQYNYDILSSVRLYFPEGDQNVFPESCFRDI